MIDEIFWLEIGISPRKLESFEPTNIRNFKEKILSCSKDLKILCSFFQIESLNIKDDRDIRALLKKPKIKEFYGLFNYSIEKLDLLKEFFRGEGLSENYIEIPLLGLIYLYEKDKKKIIDSYTYFLYNKSPMSEIWVCEPAISMEILEKFRSQTVNLSKYTKECKLGKNRMSREFFNNNRFYFCFEKAKKEDVAIGYQERKPIRRRGVYYIRFDLKKNNIEIRTGNPRILDLFSLILKEIGLKLYIGQSDQKESNVKDIISKIISNSSGVAKITEYVFNKLEKGINCQAIFRQNDESSKLIDSISPLRDENFIDPANINNLKSFTVDISGVSQTIQVDRSKSESISFKLTKKGLSETRFLQIISSLREEFGLELKKDYLKDTLNLSPLEIFNNIIGKMPSLLSIKEKEIYTLMITKGIINCNAQTLYSCQDNHNHKFFIAHKTCPKCGGKLEKLESRETIQINTENLLNKVLEKIRNIFGSEKVSLVNVKLGKNECKLISVKDEKTEFYLYFDCGQRLTKKIESLETSIIPIIKIVLDKQVDKEGHEVGPQIYAYNLIFDRDEIIMRDVNDRIISKYETLLLTKSREAEKSLIAISEKSKRVSGDDFEDLTFPILKSCFYGIYKWGKSQKGKPVPDGLYGIKRLNKRIGFSMIYDCKYSDGEYDLDIDEKRKAQEYIRRANKVDEVKAFSKKLSSYLIISNSINPNKFDTFANNVLKYRGWKGKILLLDVKDLIYLFKEFKKRDPIDNPLKLNFGWAFVERMGKFEGQKIILSKQIIDEILKDAELKSETINQVQVLDFLKTGIEF